MEGIRWVENARRNINGQINQYESAEMVEVDPDERIKTRSKILQREVKRYL